jgi:hypothetical protein
MARPVSFRLSRGVSEHILPTYLAHILHPTRIQQIVEMDHERALLPNDVNQRSLRVVPDFDVGTGRKRGRVSGAEWDGDDGASKGIRAVHRVMPEHASGHKRE